MQLRPSGSGRGVVVDAGCLETLPGGRPASGMTIPAAPLPSVALLAHALFARPVDVERVLGTQAGQATWLCASGRQAMSDAVRSVEHASSGPATVYVPDYFCNQALDALRARGVAVSFYPVREDLTPDWAALSCRPPARDPVVFVLVHYFGFPNATETARAFCAQHNMTLLEDAAHVLRLDGEIGLGSMVFFSLRKMLAVPSGGVLVCSDGLAGLGEPASSAGITRATVSWIARRLAQVAMVRFRVPWHPLWRYRSDDGVGEVRRIDPVAALERFDPFVQQMLSVMAGNLDDIVRTRRANYSRLRDWAQRWRGATPLFGCLPSGVCPYVFPVVVPQRSVEVTGELRRRGIPASRWPDLAPEVLAAPHEHATAIRTYERVLLLPVHQSLSTRQIDLIGRAVCKALAGAM